MKLPNGYGTIEKLPGNRRKPYAVKISVEVEMPDGTIKRKRKYLEYFSDKKMALSYLAEYNNGNVVPEHLSYASSVTFNELYDKWCVFRKGLKSNPSESTWKNYKIAYGMFAPVHDKKIVNLRAQDLQECINAQSGKSKGTIGNMKALLRGMWSYALNNDYAEKDITQGLVFEWTATSTPIHTAFTDDEIKVLWKQLYVINNIDVILIYIYTGLRPVELLDIESKDVHIKEKYMVGGTKTDAGKDRIIPLHDKIIPLVQKRLDQNRTYLITNKYGNHYTRAVYTESSWKQCMTKLGMHHTPHDCRYTFAYLADKYDMNEICKKIIMGHAIQSKDGKFKSGEKADVTAGTYTEKTLSDLIEQINKIVVDHV